MNDLITAATSGLFVEVGKVIEHMKAQQTRIAELERQLAEASAPQAADTDKVREALNKLHSDIMNIPCNALHAASPNQEVQRAYKEGHRDSRHAAAELAANMAAQAPVREVPGYKLVPIEPTKAMCAAARSVPEPVKPYPPHFHLIWDAMLAAAPLPAAPVQQEGE